MSNITSDEVIGAGSGNQVVDRIRALTFFGGRMTKFKGQTASVSPNACEVVTSSFSTISKLTKCNLTATTVAASLFAIPSVGYAACITSGTTLTCSGITIGNTTDNFGGGGLDTVIIDAGATLDSSASDAPGLTLNSAGDGDLDVTLGLGANISTTDNNVSYNPGIEVLQNNAMGNLSFTNNGGIIDASAGLVNIGTNFVSTDSIGNMSMIMNGGLFTADNSDGATRNSHGMRTRKVGGEGDSNITMHDGEMNIEGVYSHGIYSFYEDGAVGDSTITMDGGTINTSNPTNDSFGSTGLQVRYDIGTGDAVVDFGGDAIIDTVGLGGHGVFVTHRGLGDATAIMSGGTISTDGLTANGINVSSDSGNFPGVADWGGATTILMTDGSITTLGNESVGLRAISNWKSVVSQVQVTQSGGTITTSGDLSYGIQAQRRDYDAVGFIADGDILITQGANAEINTSGATAHGIFADLEKVEGTIDIEVAGEIETSGDDAIGILATTRMLGTHINSDAITINMTGGSVLTDGTNAHGISGQHFGDGAINITTAGDITVGGAGADGIYALGALGNVFTIAVDDGSIAAGTGTAAAVRTASTGGGTIDIAASAVVDGSASGTAIRDGDADRDGVDEIGGNLVVTTAGVVTGASILGLGNDVFNLTDGMHTGNIYGDDIVASAADGSDAFNWTGGALDGDFYGGNGSDTALIAAGAVYDGTQTLDGGDNVAIADTWTDALTFQGQTATAAAGTITNWENVIIDGGSMGFADGTLTVSADTGLGLFLANGGTLNASGGFGLTGNLNNGGAVTVQDGVAGGVVSVSGDYIGGGQLLVDTDFFTDTSDTLVIAGSVSGAPTTVTVTDISSGLETGNDVLVVDVTGTTAVGDFILAGGPVASGVFNYDLELQGSQFFLAQQSGINATGAAYEMTPVTLGSFNRLATLEQRAGARTQNAGQSAWVRMDVDRSTATYTSDSSHDTTFWGLQAGADFDFEAGQNGHWVLGVSAQYGDMKAAISNPSGAGSIDTEGYGLGVTATWYGDDGTYVDAQGQINWLHSDISSSTAGLLVADHSSTTYALSLEAGHRFTLSDNHVIVPQVQLTRGSVDGGTFTDSIGNAVDLGVNTSTIGRLGLAYEFNNGDAQSAYVIVNLLHDFSGESSVNVASTDLTTTAVSKNWAEIGLGGSMTFENRLEIYGETSFRAALDGGLADAGTGIGGTVGLRYEW